MGLQVPGMRIIVQRVVRKENRIQKFRSAGSCSFSLGSNVLRMGGDGLSLDFSGVVTFESIFGRLNILAGSLPAPVLNKLPQPKSHSPRNRNCRHLPRQSFIAGISISQEVRCLKDIVGKAKQDRRFRLGPLGFPDFRYKTKLQVPRSITTGSKHPLGLHLLSFEYLSENGPEPSKANQTQSPKCEDFQRLRAAVSLAGAQEAPQIGPPRLWQPFWVPSRASRKEARCAAGRGGCYDLMIAGWGKSHGMG